MIMELTLEAFLKRNRITQETWEAAKLDWKTLHDIGIDHEANQEQLHASAEMTARVMQKFKGVHSVRWRVKDTEHLLEKIVRKRSEGSPKYQDITASNYFTIITDLIGVRALHLFKNDCEDIDDAIRESWSLAEKPIVYTRKGDDSPQSHFGPNSFAHQEHPKGYRSIHYIISTQPLRRTIFTEIQVRTIFEEGWSEIDHRVRHPNFSENELVGYFLGIFNRLAGQADEMGGFVKELALALFTAEHTIATAHAEKDESLRKMEAALAELQDEKRQGAQYKKSINKLKSELEKLKENSALENLNYQPTKSFGINGITDLHEKYKSIFEATKSLPRLEGLQGLEHLSNLNIPNFATLDPIFTKGAAQLATAKIAGLLDVTPQVNSGDDN
ncbi:RelA/SpoT domain-containing protein [Pseudomonas alcaligenes]|uniref:RelA/SpoT domain-containing protein n=1 Tax=Aquipseudomonas alcaligenes TaxID=43263 RepID=UPI002E7B9DC0|nr:RelA/SpoT domain-containing protein [Pseudomonas alcaligenes]MEE1948528.1 RelA/SpoT domain-containing protein [Pseudomonas alcaligenes]